MDAVRLLKVRSWAATGRAKAIREQAGMTLGEMSSQLGIHRSTLVRWEKGEQAPQERLAHLYLELLERLESSKP